MRSRKQNIKTILKTLGFVVILLAPFCVKADTDTVPPNFTTWLNTNLAALNDWYNGTELWEIKGEFEYTAEPELDKAKQEGSNLFTLELGGEDFYHILTEMNSRDKQALIRSFCYYETYIAKELKEAGLPEDIRFFAPALSAMNPLAVDVNKRAGIWQLSHFQGVLNGLFVNELVDERLNEKLATKAFVLQIKENEKLFGNIELALLAYLVGNAKLNNTLGRMGQDYSLKKTLELLPNSVRTNIAAFQAFRIYFNQNTFAHNEETMLPDTVLLHKQTHLKQIAELLQVSEKQLKVFNPQFRYAIIPGDKKTTALIIPKGKKENYIAGCDSMYRLTDPKLFEVVAQHIEYPPAPNRQYLGEKVKDLEIEGKTKIKYTIKSGDVLGFIADDYDVRVADLKYWNNIYNERRIQVGQELDIFVDNDKAAYYSKLQRGEQSKLSAQNKVSTPTETYSLPSFHIPDSVTKIEHTVRSGESPYVIAKKYDGVSPEDILEWNGIKDARKIQIGQKLIIYTQ